MCTCDNTADCSSFTLAEIEDENADYSSCTTGCPAITKYKFKNCKSGYEFVDGYCEKSGAIKFAVRASVAGGELKFLVEQATSGTSSYLVDWGDGSSDNAVQHTYSRAGNYTVTVTGNITSFIMSNLTTGKEVYVTELLDLSLSSVTKMKFNSNCEKLEGKIPNFPPNLEDGSGMFFMCKMLTGSIPELPENLVNGRSMFQGCEKLTGRIPFLPRTLKDGYQMFYLSSVLGEGLSGGISSLPPVLEDGTAMFANNVKLEGDVPWLPSTLKQAGNMFQNTKLSGEPPETRPSSMRNCIGMFGGTQVSCDQSWDVSTCLERWGACF